MTSPFWEEVESKIFENIINNDNYMSRNLTLKQKLINFYYSETGKKLKNRIKSFLWGAVMMAIAGIADILAQEIGNVNIGNSNMILLGLILAQISKYLNNEYRLNK